VTEIPNELSLTPPQKKKKEKDKIQLAQSRVQ
jgi:hypothetical protein